MTDPHCEEEATATAAPPEEGAPTWMVTFGDLMSLLLTFFILLFSMSEIEMERFLLASQSLRQAVGGTAPVAIPDPQGLMPDPVDPALRLQRPGAAETTITEPSPAEPAPSRPSPAASEEERSPAAGEEPVDPFVDDYLDRLAQRLEAFVQEHDLAPEVRVERAGEGVYLRMETVAFFESGDAALRPAARPILEELAALTRSLHVGLAVSGHADDRPITSRRYPSNWELSAARAAGVARLLVAAGQDPARVRVEAFAEYRPVAANDSPDGRERNRRVDLFFARSDVVAAAARLRLLPDTTAAPVVP